MGLSGDLEAFGLAELLQVLVMGKKSGVLTLAEGGTSGGLLAAVLFFLSNGSIINPVTKGIAVVSFALLTFTKLDPTFIIIGAGILGALVF